MSGRLREALQALWEHVYFWGLILAIIIIGVIVIGDPFGYRTWALAHREWMAGVAIVCTLAAIVVGARRK